jgi:hypothetical protein
MKKLFVILIPLLLLYAPTRIFYSDWGWGYYYWLFGPVGPSTSEGMAAAGYYSVEYRGFTQFSIGGWPGPGTQIASLVLRLRNNTGGAGLQIDINRVTSSTPGWDECGGTEPIYATHQPVNAPAEEYTYFDLTGTQAVNDFLSAWQSGSSWFGLGYKGSRGSGEPGMHYFYACWFDPNIDAALIVNYTIVGIEEAEERKIASSMLSVYPNPFTQMTEIRLPITDSRLQMTANRIQLKIYDVTGCLVRDFSQLLSDIDYRSSIIWDARDDHGLRVPAGIYFCTLESGTHNEITKLILLR